MKTDIIKTFILGFSMLASCSHQDRQITHDTQRNAMPSVNNGKDTAIYNELRELERELKLPDSERQNDSIQIKIWYGYSTPATQLLIIRSQRGEWLARKVFIKYTFHDSPYDSLRKTTLQVSENEGVLPKTPWNSVMNRLFQKQLLTLPEMSSIDGYETGLHGNNVVVEIFTSKAYRMYDYWQPILYKDRFKEAQMITDIMEILEEEFGFMRQDFI